MGLPKTNRIANAQSTMAAVQTAHFSFSFFLSLLVLCLAAVPVRAAVTFTISPSVVSNAYNGLITLQINGLTNGVTNVVVQKFFDVNTNSRVDSSDLLVQQFRLTVGQVNVFTNEATSTPVTITNFMPADTSSVTDQMTVPLNFQNGDFAQTLVGQYLYKISSLTNSATNLFIVTNSPFSCVVTGAVVNAATFPSYTNLPYSLVLLCLNQGGPIVVQAGAVANSSGTFSFRAPPGNYVMAAAKSNFVDDISQSGLTLVAKTTTNGSVALTSATTNITGRIINSANSNAIAGISGSLISTNEQISFYFTDTNGNFYAPVTTNFWEAPEDAFAAAFQGDLTWQTNSLLNVSNKTVSFTNALPRESAIFYGVVSNNAAVPLPGVYVYAYDNAGHQSIGISDNHGKYVVGASAGTNVWNLFVLWPDNPGLTNTAYVFSPGFLQMTLGTNQAVQQNFSLLTAPYSISGTVKDFNGNPVVGVEVFATNATYDAANGVTAADGSYAINVSPGTWTVGIDAASLLSAGYTNAPPPNLTVIVSDSPVTGVNFLIEVCGEISILTTNLVDGMVGDYYETNLTATSCQNITNWAPAFGITLTSLYDSNIVYSAGTAIYSESHLLGFVESEFGVSNRYNPNTRLDEAYFTNCTGSTSFPSGSTIEFENVTATINVTGPMTNGATVTIKGQGWTVTQDTTPNGSNYTATLKCNNNLPSSGNGYGVQTGYIAAFGETITTGTTVSNTVASVLGTFHSIPTFGDSAIVATSIPITNSANSVVFIRHGAHIAQYFMSAYGPQSTNLPPGMSLYPDGTLAGTPTDIGTNGGNFNFSVMAEDTSSNVTVQPLSIFIFPATTLAGPTSAQAGGLQSSNTFPLYLGGLTNEFNYTVFMTTNLASPNWVPIFTTNNPITNSAIVPDTTATNATRFYRLQISQ
ncbi:MAG TPA: carboxypeptidase-like regulatory domain-containing protein [Verrucomicrobiae bacterium]|jgi:hypothetical protein|nr:carboxypeptidase-like regulatory domain-containing protein [Verrucomicrobiae bacterium]